VTATGWFPTPGSPNSVDFMAASARLENVAPWFAPSVLMTAGVNYALKLEDDRPKSHPILVPPGATPQPSLNPPPLPRGLPQRRLFRAR
jgi:hypothetical protein